MLAPDDMFEKLSDGIYYVDIERKITYWNSAAEKITGFTREEVVGKYCYDNFLKHMDVNGVELCLGGCPLSQSIEERRSIEARVFLRTKKGHRKPVAVRVTPLKNEKDEIVGAVEIFTDNSTFYLMREEMESLKKEIYTDDLTGIGNRKYFDFIMSSKIFELDTYRVQAGLIFLDIDNFKRVNDNYGHKVGDRALKMVAKSAVNGVRAFDYVCRWGGEELVIIITNADEELLKKVARRLRLIIENSYFMLGEERMGVTVSVGATMVMNGDTVDSVVERVDRLMYKSKKGGKNRVTFG